MNDRGELVDAKTKELYALLLCDHSTAQTTVKGKVDCVASAPLPRNARLFVQAVERPSFRDGHSDRRAAIGSMHAARQAGIIDATRAPRPSNNVAVVSMTGSHGCTPNS